MEATHNQTSSFENYPFLTAEEFAEACHHLDRRYCQATLGPVRRQWKLRANTALLMAFTPLAEYSTYVQIIRPLDGELDDEGLSAQLDKLSFDAPGIGEPTSTVDADEHMVDEENDTSALRKPPVKQEPFGYVTYEIHLHPTYRAPCLWFKLNGLGPDELAFDIDTVFRRLVPDQYKDALRNNGPMGGISIDVGSFRLFMLFIKS
ncbi:E2-like conjugating enzyme atg10 [Coniochaeta pulveracea]|uniref:E2-like conjugating enzyme atg10 n=1 Tax=Coniochaeta pulveracea TaxID=177199 RepID=A0A420Y349_9PEZI|nr:E2-like conjugating enzyme atg10 [Coniochaeta pulveracea]